MLLAVAHLNGLAFLINGFEFAVGSSPYATVVHALCGAAFVIGVVATAGVVLTGLRAVGHQLTTDNESLLRGSALLWHAASLSWIAAFYTVFVSK